MPKTNLYDIYYVRDSDECLDIIFDFGLSRFHTGHDCLNENEGIEKLIVANTNALNKLRDDIFYEERILIEAITFLQFLLCFQKKPHIAWFDYYKQMLSIFHTHNKLLYKQKIYTPRNYWTKKDCAVITLMDSDVNLHYKTAKELSMDFGRYRSDLIIRTIKKQQEVHSQLGKKTDDEDWKILPFSFILGTLL